MATPPLEAIIDKVLELLKAQKLDGIRSYMFGDPLTYPSFELPAVAVAPLNETVVAHTMGARGRDMRGPAIRIFVVMSAKDGYNSATKESPVDRKLIQHAEAVLEVLRANIDLEGTVVTFKEGAVQYVPAVRGREAVRMAQVDCRFEVLKSR